MAMTAKDLVARGSEILNRKKECINIEIDGVGVWRLRVPTPDEWNDNNVYFDAHKNEARNVDVVHVFRQCEEPNLKDAEAMLAAQHRDSTKTVMLVNVGASDDLAYNALRGTLQELEALKSECLVSDYSDGGAFIAGQ